MRWSNSRSSDIRRARCGEAIFTAGSFGRAEGDVQAGLRSGNWGVYFGGERITGIMEKLKVLDGRFRVRAEKPGKVAEPA